MDAMYKKTYKCHDCNTSVTVYVPIKDTPTHPCPRHKDKIRTLDEVETRNSKRGQNPSEQSE